MLLILAMLILRVICVRVRGNRLRHHESASKHEHFTEHKTRPAHWHYREFKMPGWKLNSTSVSRDKKIWKHRSRKRSSMQSLQRRGLKGVSSILRGTTSSFFSLRSHLILLSRQQEESTENFPWQTGTEIYQARTYRSSPPSWEESCRLDKAYHCKVCVERDKTGCDQELKKA